MSCRLLQRGFGEEETYTRPGTARWWSWCGMGCVQRRIKFPWGAATHVGILQSCVYGTIPHERASGLLFSICMSMCVMVRVKTSSKTYPNPKSQHSPTLEVA